ncbi:(S)-norcoclaurine synthase protein [Dioscorea alata]|uniref:(S)-norcoclaurine synthase protein n=1 Tax=Dioscorea alata TaxID=55571 RepID=A0ACB7WHM1_DIOAL|nr:(S)-norcoclaurine synthase protein [Dioscorea alata]
MKGAVSHELEVALPAEKIWAVYRGLRLAELIVELLPNLLNKFEIIEGDGEVGTILRLHWPPGMPMAMVIYKEKFTKVDDERRVKEVHTIEGGFLQLGFSSYMVRLEIIAKGEAASIIRSVIEYEVDDKFANNVSFVSTTTLATIHETIGKYLVEQES